MHRGRPVVAALLAALVVIAATSGYGAEQSTRPVGASPVVPASFDPPAPPSPTNVSPSSEELSILAAQRALAGLPPAPMGDLLGDQRSLALFMKYGVPLAADEGLMWAARVAQRDRNIATVDKLHQLPEFLSSTHDPTSQSYVVKVRKDGLVAAARIVSRDPGQS